MSDAHDKPPIPDSQPRPVPPVEGLAPGDVSAWLHWGTRVLAEFSDSARADAEELMAAQIGVPRAQLSMRGEDAFRAADALRYAGAVERRRVGEPVAYITGRQGFWTVDLAVNPAVLIPRPDTETLVEWALQIIRATGGESLHSFDLADLGTGSGAIALALAHERAARVRVVATDRSDAALQLARENARALGLDAIDFRHGSWFDALHAAPSERFDLIVSNPPYIAEGDPHLAALRHEPRLALTSGADGLDAIRTIVVGAPAHLAPRGWLLLEHGHEQGGVVRGLLESAGFTDVQTRRDLGGRERVSGGRRA